MPRNPLPLMPVNQVYRNNTCVSARVTETDSTALGFPFPSMT